MTSAASTSALGSLAEAVTRRIETMQRDEIVRRIWERDHTVWKPDPTELANRLGWLDVTEEMVQRFDILRALRAEVVGDGYTTAVLLGMGGSSLGPEVLRDTLGMSPDGLELHVLDSTDPAAVRAVSDYIDTARTLFIVASKSGTTVETLSHFAFFWDQIPEGAHFVAITDPGSELAKTGEARGFRRVFLNDPDIGGRYAVLSYFGLVEAALLGADLDRLLTAAREMREACRPEALLSENPGAWLGAVMGEAALTGRYQLTLVLPPGLRSLGYWVEQLVAESTGKEGLGILPIEGEPLGTPEVYSEHRLFVTLGEHDGIDALEAAGHPVVRITPEQDLYALGGEFFRWEFATAVACYVLGVNPFDQPDVQEAKDSANRFLRGEASEAPPSEATLDSVLESAGPGDYVALLAYVQRVEDMDRRLIDARVRLRDRLRVATTSGFGPRFLHSTGQLHKGGPNSGVFIQVLADDAADLPIPGQTFTFGQLKRAQADGDLAALLSRGRRAVRVTPDELDRLSSW